MIDKTPAFPVFPETSVGHAAAHQGMTLRDYFAAKAMQAFMREDIVDWKRLGKASYLVADVMMEARNE
jgi:hypothetical protein